jgi:hypothetical protein
MSFKVAAWKTFVHSPNFNPNGAYTIADTAQAIAGLPASDIVPGLVGIQATDAPLVLDFSQATAVVAVNAPALASGGAPTISVSGVAPSGENAVTLADNIANITSITGPLKEALNFAGFTAYAITDTAAHINNLTEQQIQAAAALGVTKITSDGSLVFSTDLAVELLNDGGNIPNSGALFNIVVPPNDTVIVSGNNSELIGLSATTLQNLGYLGVSAIDVSGAGRPQFSVDQEAALALALNDYSGAEGNNRIALVEPGAPGNVNNVATATLTYQELVNDEPHPSQLQPNTAYSLTIDPSSLAVALQQDSSVFTSAPVQVTEIFLQAAGASDLPIDLTVAEAETLEQAALPIVLSSPGFVTVTVVDTAQHLTNMSDEQLEALGAIGVNQVAGSDTVPIFSADQMNALESAGIAVVGDPFILQVGPAPTVITSQFAHGMTIDIT